MRAGGVQTSEPEPTLAVPILPARNLRVQMDVGPTAAARRRRPAIAEGWMLVALSDAALRRHYCAPALIIDSIKMAVKLQAAISCELLFVLAR